MTLKKSFLIVLLLFIVAGVYSWQSSKGRPEQYTGPVEKIVLGAGLDIFSSPIWIAENRGYFKEQGLDVQIQIDGSGAVRMKKMLEQGSPDMVAAAPSPIVLNSFKRNDYAIIAGIVHSYRELSVLGRRDKGIERPSDLKGKTIGMTKGSTGQFFLDLFLRVNGLDISEVKTIDGQPPELVQDLVNGKVDAISSWQPFISHARKALGESAVLFPPDYIFRNEFYLISRKIFIKEHPATLNRFLEAIEKAEKFIKKNREEAIDIISERIKIDRDTVAAIWDGYVFQLFLDQSTLASLEEIARWAVKNKIIEATETPNYLDFIYPDILETVNPGAARIVH